MELLVAAGRPDATIKAATSVGANCLGKSNSWAPWKKKLADLIIIDGDPLMDITRANQIVVRWSDPRYLLPC
jgi:imidazolonepropionase-like amidohydrolase